MAISLENYLQEKINQQEAMHDYGVATDTIRCWIDEYKSLKNK